MEFHFLQSKTYEKVLRLLSLPRAIDLEMRTGMTKFQWLMQDQLFVPDRDTWKTCVHWKCKTQPKHEYLGLLMYLIEYRVPCLDFPALLQECFDRGRIRELLILMKNNVLDENGARWKSCALPRCDKAIMRGKYEMVALSSILFNHVLVRRQSKVLQFLFYNWNQGTSTILHTLIPKYITSIHKADLLRIAALVPDAIHFALQHCSESAVTSDLMLDLAARGNQNAMSMAFQKNHSLQMNRKIWNEAYLHEQFHITDAYKDRFQVDDQLISQACREGYANIIDNLPIEHKLPVGCLDDAITSGNANLILSVASRVDNLTITRAMLIRSILSTKRCKHIPFKQQTTETNPFLAVFYLSKRVAILDNDIKCMLVDHGLTDTILALKRFDDQAHMGIDIFNQYTLARAVATMNIDLLNAMHHYEFTREALEFAEAQNVTQNVDWNDEDRSWEAALSRTREERIVNFEKRQCVTNILHNMQKLIK